MMALDGVPEMAELTGEEMILDKKPVVESGVEL